MQWITSTDDVVVEQNVSTVVDERVVCPYPDVFPWAVRDDKLLLSIFVSCQWYRALQLDSQVATLCQEIHIKEQLWR